MKNKINNVIKLTYYKPYRPYKASSNYLEETHSLNHKQLDPVSSQSRYDVPLRQNKNLKSSSLDSPSKYEWSESYLTDGTPCDRMCKGKKRVTVNLVCRSGQKKVNDSLCPGGKSRPQQKEQICNAECETRLLAGRLVIIRKQKTVA